MRCHFRQRRGLTFVHLCLLLGLLGGFLPGSPSPARAAVGHISVSLLASTEQPQPGQTFTIGVQVIPDPGWHSYWSNPGESGLAPTVAWQAPARLSFGPLEHPAPQLLNVMGITSYVHEGKHILLSKVRVGSSISRGTPLPITAQMRWLACSASLCVPGHATLHLDLVAGAGSPGPAAPALKKAAQQLPRRAQPGSFAKQNGKLVLQLPHAMRVNAAGLAFFPDQNGVVDSTAERVSVAGDTVEIAMPSAGPLGASISGVVSDGRDAYRLAFRRSETPAAASVSSVTLDPAAAHQAPTSADGDRHIAPSPTKSGSASLLHNVGSGAAAVDASPSILGALVAAILGGLLLNLMPCVFPVLSIKAIALARAGTSQRTARVDALAYMAGTILACSALGLLIMLLRLAGDQVGWSFQLQHPATTLALILLATTITLNLAGVFEVPGVSVSGTPSSLRPAVMSLSAGALTAFVATPCSGPFMAGALGATLLLPPVMSLAIYAGLGFGLALPMLAVAFLPSARRALPAPGPWMETFRRWMALPTGLAAVALLWLLQRQAGSVAGVEAVLLVILISLSLWWIGARQKRDKRGSWRGLIPLAAAAAGLILMEPTYNSVGATPASSVVQQFSETRLAQLRRAGVPVFVDITADWCLTCKINERFAIDRPETRAAFNRAGIVMLRGDWTNGDPAITRFLASQGRNSIPFYLFYPARDAPEVLPQLLSVGSLRKLAEANPSKSLDGTPAGVR